VDLLIIVVLAIILLPVALLTTGVLRVILGVAFILFFPGYSLMAALFPGKSSIGRVERLALSFGLSIAIVPLIGLGLNYTPWGIHLTPILACVLAFIMGMSAVAWLRRRRLPSEERPGWHWRLARASLARYWVAQKRLDKTAMVALVIAIVVAVGVLIYVIATPRIGERYSEFYVLGMNDKAADYPTNLKVGQTGRVILGIVNHEQGDTAYRIEIDIGGQKIGEVAGFSLRDGEKWEQTVTFTPAGAGDGQRAEFLLYKNTAATPADSLHFGLDVKP
jgi:uncharacterized membrane protein